MEANSYVLSPLLARRKFSVFIWKDWHPCSNSCTHVPAVVQHWTAGFSARSASVTSGCIPTYQILTAGIASSSGCYCNPVSTRSLDVTTWMYSSSVCVLLQHSVPSLLSRAVPTTSCTPSHSLHLWTVCSLFLTRQVRRPPSNSAPFQPCEHLKHGTPMNLNHFRNWSFVLPNYSKHLRQGREEECPVGLARRWAWPAFGLTGDANSSWSLSVAVRLQGQHWGVTSSPGWQE